MSKDNKWIPANVVSGLDSVLEIARLQTIELLGRSESDVGELHICGDKFAWCVREYNKVLSGLAVPAVLMVSNEIQGQMLAELKEHTKLLQEICKNLARVS